MYLLQTASEALITCTATNEPLRYRCGEVLRVALLDGNINTYRLLMARDGQTILAPGVGPHVPGKVYRIVGRQMS